MACGYNPAALGLDKKWHKNYLLLFSAAVLVDAIIPYTYKSSGFPACTSPFSISLYSSSFSFSLLHRLSSSFLASFGVHEICLPSLLSYEKVPKGTVSSLAAKTKMKARIGRRSNNGENRGANSFATCSRDQV